MPAYDCSVNIPWDEGARVAERHRRVGPAMSPLAHPDIQSARSAPSGFSDQLGEICAPTASQHLHTKRDANQDSGTVSGSESTLRTVSCAHALHEAKSEIASSQRTSPSVAGSPGGGSGSIYPTARAMLGDSVSSSMMRGIGCGLPVRSALRINSASHSMQENICTS
jgi:hypothetical protein